MIKTNPVLACQKKRLPEGNLNPNPFKYNNYPPKANVINKITDTNIPGANKRASSPKSDAVIKKRGCCPPSLLKLSQFVLIRKVLLKPSFL